MTQRRGTTIKLCAVSDVMSRLSELPERGEDSGGAVSLGKIFRLSRQSARRNPMRLLRPMARHVRTKLRRFHSGSVG
jgi:hypothetical protein